MNSQDAVDAVVAWVSSVLPELTGVYNHVPASKPSGLPDAVVEGQRTGITDAADTRFRYWSTLQQRSVYYVEIEVSFMVDNSNTATGAATLRGYEASLLSAVLEDQTLGGRVPFASPYVEFDFTRPYVEYEDGTRGREMTMTLAVGDLVEATS